MLFLQPISLLWLLLLVPLILFFYLLRMKRRTVTVSSIYLWSAVTQDVQANAPFQRLRRSLLLLLQLLLAAFLVFALARPFFEGKALGGSNVIVILDGSASMQSSDVSPSRFAEARRLTHEMIDRMRGPDKMMLILATERASRLTSFTGDRRALRAALNQAAPADTATNLEDALELAISAGGSGLAHASSRIYVLSDGAYPDMPSIDTRGCDLQFVKIGIRGDNAGIVAADVRRSLNNPDAFQMFMAVRNFSPAARQGAVEIYRDKGLIAVEKVALKPADPSTGYSESTIQVNDLPVRTGILRLKLDIKDDLVTDNEAFVALAPRRKVKILLVSKGNLYLERALLTDADTEVDRIAPEAYSGKTRYDIVVFDGKAPDVPATSSTLFINTGGDAAPVEIERKARDISIVDWERGHPIMRYVKLDRIYAPTAFVARLKPWGVKLAEHEEGPVIAVGERAGLRSAFIGFDPLQTDLPLRVAFPILISNLVQWLTADAAGAETRTVRSGVPITIPVDPAVRSATLSGPGNLRLSLPVARGAVQTPGLEHAGVYSVAAGGRQYQLAANLLNREESSTAPRTQLQLGRRPVPASSGYVRTTLETWRWLALLALVILGFEWWVYHRRL